MKLQEIRQQIKQQLAQQYSSSEAGEITLIILEWALKADRQFIANNNHSNISEAVEVQISAAIGRLLQNEPIQYIVGEAYFYKRKFTVSSDVLIPRPETEELVELVLSYIPKEREMSVLDIGTGSGCIPISIKLERPNTNVTAIDFSTAALAVAQSNAEQLKANIEWSAINFLKASSWENFKQFDIIVSNPPYIPVQEKSIMAKHVVSFEPNMALFVPDESPFIFYQAIADFAEKHLSKNGKIFMEIHQAYAKEVAAIFMKKNYSTSIIKDISGNDRMVMVTHFQ